MIQNDFITLSLAEFEQILQIPYNGQAVFTNEWDLASLSIFQDSEGPYHTELPTPDKIRGHRDHLPACLAHMLYCIVAEEQYNLAYLFAKRIESARATSTANLSYVMRPLALRQTHKPQSDRGMPKARHSVSSSSAHHYRSLSHHENDGEDEGTSRASTPSPTSYLNSLSSLQHSHVLAKK
ncbi:hypothetical protein Tco_1287128 [Tanacetum coccineum]